MARRAKGEGSVHRDGDGYRASVPLPPDRDGKRRRLSRRARTKTAAAALLPQLRAEAGLAGEDETLPDFLDRWHRASSRDWSERNQDSVRVIIDKHLVPVLGRVQLRDLTRGHVQRLIDQKLAEGLSNQTVRHIHTQLRSALGEAMRQEIITRNVAKLVRPPKIVERHVAPVGPAQGKALLEAVAGDRYEALYLVALVSGLRQGELIGLRWQDLDLDSGDLHVTQTIQRRSRRWLIGTPKSEAGRRLVSLPPRVLERLQTHRRQQLEHRLVVGPAWEDWNLVFPGATGAPLHGSSVTKRLQKLMAAANERVEREQTGTRIELERFHDVRHAAASLLLAQGVAITTVSELLGHSGIAITKDVYGHLVPALKHDAAAKMSEALFGTES